MNQIDLLTAIESIGRLIDHAEERYPHFEGDRGQRDIADAKESLRKLADAALLTMDAPTKKTDDAALEIIRRRQETEDAALETALQKNTRNQPDDGMIRPRHIKPWSDDPNDPRRKLAEVCSRLFNYQIGMDDLRDPKETERLNNRALDTLGEVQDTLTRMMTAQEMAIDALNTTIAYFNALAAREWPLDNGIEEARYQTCLARSAIDPEGNIIIGRLDYPDRIARDLKNAGL